MLAMPNINDIGCRARHGPPSKHYSRRAHVRLEGAKDARTLWLGCLENESGLGGNNESCGGEETC